MNNSSSALPPLALILTLLAAANSLIDIDEGRALGKRCARWNGVVAGERGGEISSPREGTGVIEADLLIGGVVVTE